MRWLFPSRRRDRADRASDPVVFLVYGCRAPEAPEPLIAVVGDEEEAARIERDTQQRFPGSAVRWETFRVVRPAGREVHLVLQLAGVGPDADPIGLGVYGRLVDAQERAGQDRSGLGVVIASLPIGWRRDGWPADRNDERHESRHAW